jgi:hypothetical protein
MARALLLLAVAGLALAPELARAQAPPTLSLTVSPAAGVDYGDPVRVSGRLTRGGAPVVGEAVVLQARRFPYRRAFAPLRTVRTDARGRFSVRRRFDRNHRLRARAPALTVTSTRESVFVFPAFRLSYRLLRENVIRLTQTYTTPRDVRLTQRTRFYVGPRGARTAPFRRRARIRRQRPGRFVSRATVRVPARYEGRFRFASCFPSDPRAGMGDPAARCPRLAFRFTR